MESTQQSNRSPCRELAEATRTIDSERGAGNEKAKQRKIKRKEVEEVAEMCVCGGEGGGWKSEREREEGRQKKKKTTMTTKEKEEAEK